MLPMTLSIVLVISEAKPVTPANISLTSSRYALTLSKIALLEESISALFKFITFATNASAAHIGTLGLVGAPTFGSPFCTAC